MRELTIFLRLVHITLGVFWAGTIFFVVLFLAPSVRAVGPDGARAMKALQQRHFMNVMPLVASVLAFVVGVFVMRAATLRTGRLSGALASTPHCEERESMQSEI